MKGLPSRASVRDLVLVDGGWSPKAQVGLGAGIGVLVLAAVVFESALIPALLAPGTGGWSESGWWALSVGLLVACVLATPVALRLWESGVEGLKKSGAGRARTLRDRVPTPATSVAGHEKDAERQLLEAIDRHGEITPARAALETTLTVAEADRMLSELAKGGHLEVRVEGGKLLYGL